MADAKRLQGSKKESRPMPDGCQEMQSRDARDDIKPTTNVCKSSTFKDGTDSSGVIKERM
jgi:hypothetical protein